MKATLSTLAVLAAAGVAWAADQPEDRDVQDVVFLGENRPAFLRLQVRQGETSAFASFDTFMAQLFIFLDRDASGSLNRTEAKQVPSVAQLNQFFTGNPYLNFGRRPAAGMPAPETGIDIEELDADKDGRVTREELQAYYQSKGIAGLVLQNNTVYSEALGLNDALLQQLDKNRDGALSRAELVAAATELLRLDADDDELLHPTELGLSATARLNRPMMRPGMANPNAPAPEPKMSLEWIPRGDRRLSARMDAARKIVAKYDRDKDGKLTAEEIGWEPKQMTAVDRNRDGKLDSLELARWLHTGKPDTEQVLQLSPGGNRPAAPRGSTASQTLTLGHVQLSVVPQPLTTAQTFDYKGQVLSQFRNLDVDRLDYLTRKQADSPTGQIFRGLFDLADRNNDNRLSREELTQYLDLVAAAAQAQVILTLSTNGQGLFGVLDRNGDGYLSVRELRQAWSHLAPFASPDTEAVSFKQLPLQVRLTVGRGGMATPFGGGAISPNPQSRPVPTQGPLWFRKMDSNGDGDVSRREWLGESADFDKLDTDGDGLISLAEAEAFDAARRK
jgi:Ca2+-binding EF-hand superfamily protein